MLFTYSFAYVSAHIFFDDAFESHLDDTFEYRVNPFVKMMVGLINKAARYLYASLHLKYSSPDRCNAVANDNTYLGSNYPS